MTITIRGIEYQIDEGATITECHNETLDSAEIRISHQTTQLNIESYDKVVLHANNKDYYLCVDTYVERMSCVKPVVYEYQISLFSETKILEGVILPNLSITQHKTGTKLTIKQYLDRYLLLYGKKHRRENNVWLDAWKLSVGNKFNVECPEMQWNQPTLREVFTDLMMVVDCIPVMRNNVISYIDLTKKNNDLRKSINTYKEVLGFPGQYEVKESFSIEVGSDRITTDFSTEFTLTDIRDWFGILGENDYIEISDVDNINGISEYEITETTNKNTFVMAGQKSTRFTDTIRFRITYKCVNRFNAMKNINYIQRTQSSSDYVSEIRMNLQNVLQTDRNLRENILIHEQKPFETDGYLVDSSNIVFKTKYPILKIKHLWFGFWTTGTDSNDRSAWIFLKQDLCNLKSDSESVYYNIVKEYKEWLTLGVFNRESDVDITKAQTFANYRPLSVYYERGGTEIKNWTSDIKTWFLWFTDSYLEILIKFIVENISVQGITDLESGKSAHNNFYRPLIEIEYETSANQVFQAGKTFGAKNDRTIVDNQTNVWVDSFTQGLLEYQKVNRLGNQLSNINARYTQDFDKLITIGDYLDDDIIYQVQYQFYNNHVEINAAGCKDYILRDYFTGVKSKLRTWVNAQDEAFERHELIKYYCEFSEKLKNEYPTELIGTPIFTFISPLIGYSIAESKSAVITNNVLSQGAEEGYFTEELTRLIGNSIVYTTGFSDNSILLNHNNILYSQYYIAATMVDPDIPCVDELEDLKGIPLEPLKYVNSYYEFSFLSLSLDYNVASFNNGYSVPFSQIDWDDFRMILSKQFNTSEHKVSLLSNLPDIVFRNIPVFKDNREIPVFSFQFEFCSDTKDIIFTKRFLELQKSLNSSNLSISGYKIYEGNIEYWNWKNPVLTGAILSSTATFNTTSITGNKSVKININNVNVNKCYYITDANDNIILALNNVREFYLSILKDRDIYIYDENENIIGDILNQ